MNSTFYLCTDSDGKMPSMTKKPNRPNWVRYVNDRPVKVKPYIGQDRVWDYNDSRMLALYPGVKSYDGTAMPVFTGQIL